MSTSARLLTGAAVAVLLGLCLLAKPPPATPAPGPSTTHAELQPVPIAAAPVIAVPQAVQTAAARAAPTDPAAPLVQTTAITKAQQVDTLAKSPSPVDAFTAYNIIHACIESRRAEAEGYEHDPYPKPMPSSLACEDLTPGQLVSRMQMLERAAAAGVYGAFHAFVLEGPGAVGMSGSEDVSTPAYADWTRRVMAYQEAGVKTGDRMSLMAMSNKHENEQPPDFAKSLAYWVAQAELSTTTDATMAGIIERLRQALTPDQAAAAIEEGQQIARAARPVEGDQH